MGDASEDCIVQLVAIEILTALANAVQRLQHLRVLQVTSVDDVWYSIHSNARNDDDDLLADLRSRMDESKLVEAAAAVDAVIAEGQLSYVLEATAAFSTFDDYGSWLLQQHPKLTELHLDTGFQGLSMPWQQQQQQQTGHSTNSSMTVVTETTAAAAATATAASTTTGITCCLHCITRAKVHLQDMAVSDTDRPESDLHQDLLRYLARYSNRPVDELLGHITSCKLWLKQPDVDQLSDLLNA